MADAQKTIKIEKFKVINSMEGIKFLRISLEKIAQSWDLSNKLLLELNLILEELCSNYIGHAGEDPKSFLDIQLILEKECLEIRVVDCGQQFNPTKTQDPDTNLSIDKRKPGGLGLYFVKHFSDSMMYSREDGKNVVTITKSLTTK